MFLDCIKITKKITRESPLSILRVWDISFIIAVGTLTPDVYCATHTQSPYLISVTHCNRFSKKKYFQILKKNVFDLSQFGDVEKQTNEKKNSRIFPRHFFSPTYGLGNEWRIITQKAFSSLKKKPVLFS